MDLVSDKRSNHAARMGSTEEVIMKLRTIGLFVILTLGLLAVSLPAEAKQAGSK